MGLTIVVNAIVVAGRETKPRRGDRRDPQAPPRQHAERVPTRTIPHVVVRIAAVFMAEYRPVAADLGYIQKVPNDKARVSSARSRGPPKPPSSPLPKA